MNIDKLIYLCLFKLSLKIFLGKETIESNDNKIQKTFLIPFFGHDFMNFEKNPLLSTPLLSRFLNQKLPGTHKQSFF